MAGSLESRATCSYTKRDSSWVECASWLLLIPFWLDATCRFLSTSHIFSLSSSSSFPHQQIMAPQRTQQCATGSELSWMAGASSNTPPTAMQLQCRQQLVHRDTANEATKSMTIDAHSNMDPPTGSSKNKMRHVIGCEDIHIKVDHHQLTI